MKLISEAKTTQRQSLSLTMRNSVQLLNLPLLECAELVQSTLQTNPFLVSDTDNEDIDAPTPPISAPIRIRLESPYNNENSQLFSNGPEQLEETQLESFKERLAAELATLRLDEPLVTCLAFVVEAIDDRGRIPDSINEVIPESVPFFKRYHEQWETGVKLVQAVCGNGIGARSLKECFWLQLKERQGSRTRELALLLINCHWQDWFAVNNEVLQRRLACTEKELLRTKQLIGSLNPAPGRQHDNTPLQTVLPDVYVYLESGYYCIAPNTDVLPWLSVHADAKRWKREVRVVDPEVKRLMSEAEELALAVRRRHLTVVRVAAEIIARQMGFFDIGNHAISPLLLREVAESLGLHESTVSRATSQKYMQTASGVIEFKQFFSRSIPTANGHACSTAAVKALLSDIITEESPQKPLSDVELVDCLSNEGVKVARRTVTKYRQQLNFPSFKERQISVPV